MKKFFILALALTFVAGFAYAADEEKEPTLEERVEALETSSSKFKVSGQYRVEMYNRSNAGFDGNGKTVTLGINAAGEIEEVDDSDVDAGTQETWVDQRFRAKFTWMPADGVTAVLQGDFAETMWDYDYRPGAGSSTIMVDNAHVDLTKEMVNLKLGLQTTSLGKGVAYGYQGAQIAAAASFEPVSVNAIWMKVEEGATDDDAKGRNNKAFEDADPGPDGILGTADDRDLLDDDNLNKDEDFYGLQVAYDAEMFSAGAFYGTKQDMNGGRGENVLGFGNFGRAYDGTLFTDAGPDGVLGTADDVVAPSLASFDWQESTVNVIGLFGSGSVGKISFWGEFNQFSGQGKDVVFATGPDAGVADEATDIDFVGQQVALNGEMAVNEQLSVGLDLFYAQGYDGDDEVQVSTVYDNDDYVPLDHGPFKWIYSNGLDVFMVDINSGGQGANLYGTFAPLEGLTLYANAGYSKATKEDPLDLDWYVKSFTVVSLSASYAFLPGTSFNLKYENVSRDVKNPSGLKEDWPGYLHDDAISTIMAMVKVSF